MCLLKLHDMLIYYQWHRKVIQILLPITYYVYNQIIAWGYREAATLIKVSQLHPSKGPLHQECHNLFTVWGDQGSSEAADKCHWTHHVADTRVPSETVIHCLTAGEGMSVHRLLNCIFQFCYVLLSVGQEWNHYSDALFPSLPHLQSCSLQISEVENACNYYLLCIG